MENHSGLTYDTRGTQWQKQIGSRRVKWKISFIMKNIYIYVLYTRILNHYFTSQKKICSRRVKCYSFIMKNISIYVLTPEVLIITSHVFSNRLFEHLNVFIWNVVLRNSRCVIQIKAIYRYKISLFGILFFFLRIDLPRENWYLLPCSNDVHMRNTCIHWHDISSYIEQKSTIVFWLYTVISLPHTPVSSIVMFHP